MSKLQLRDYRILVVEDEYMLADELQIELGDAGAIVLGPVGNLEGAMNLIASEQRIDGAVLDVNLCGDMVFPAADLLAECGVPFVFTTGYDAGSIPPRFVDVARCEKPVNVRKVAQSIEKAVHAYGSKQ